MSQETEPAKPDCSDAIKLVKELRDYGTTIETQLSELGSFITQTTEETTTRQTINFADDMPPLQAPVAESQKVSTPSGDVVEAVNKLDRPARARGLTELKHVKWDSIPLYAQILEANPMRRSFAVSTGGGLINIGPYQLSQGIVIDGGGFNVPSTAYVFTEEEWGGWIQQAWFNFSDSLLVPTHILEEIYLQ